jgi:hypothetical protein
MKKMRLIHLYLGCVFAPMLVFFALSGMWQTLGFSYTDKKSNGQLTTWSERLRWVSGAHTHQRSPYMYHQSQEPTYAPLRWHENDGKVLPYTLFLSLMAVGLIATTILGVIMAFRFSPRRGVVGGCLIFGVACPLFLLYLKS